MKAYCTLITMKATEISQETENNAAIYQVKSKLIGASTEAGSLDLDQIGSIVKEHSGTTISLKKPKSYELRVCGQDETVYDGNEDQMEAWEDHYLFERKRMEVIGAIDDFPCDAYCRQLVLLLCEDGNIYAYEDEVLHLVARSLSELLESGMTFPGIETFNLGECFEDYTEEEYNEWMEHSEIKEMREEHRKFRESLQLELLSCLTEIKNKTESGEQKNPKMTSHSDTIIKPSNIQEIVPWPPMPLALDQESWCRHLYPSYPNNSCIPGQDQHHYSKTACMV